MAVRWFWFLVLLYFAPAAYAGSVAWPADVAGRLVYREGAVAIQRSSKPQDWLRPGDHIVTGKDGRAFILFGDGATLSLGEQADCAVDVWSYAPNRAGRNTLRLTCAKGAFLYAGGAIARDDPAGVRIAVRLAVIGTAGTVWAGTADTFGVFAHRGTASVATGRGRIRLKEGQGSLLISASAAPGRPAAWPPDRLQASLATVRIHDARQLAAALATARRSLPSPAQGGQ